MPQPVVESSDPFFAGVARRTVQTSAGPCELPILYSDASLLTLVYAVDPAIARAHVDPRGFEPLVVMGKAWMAFCAFEYRATTIGPYGELGLGLLVKRAGTSPSLLGLARDQRKVRDAGLLVMNLPVTTPNARAAGVELWGFPKYVTGMETSFRADGIRVVLEGELEVTMKRGLHVKTRGLPLCLYSVNAAEHVLRTIVETDGAVEWGGARSVEMKLLGEGPTAKTMRAFGMHERKPVVAYCTDRLRSILPLGEDMGPLAGASSPRAGKPVTTNGAPAHGAE